MHVSEICTRQVVTCARDTGVRALAQLTRERHVGDVVVVRVLAKGLDVDAVTAGDLMGERLTTAFDSEDVYDATWHVQSRHPAPAGGRCTRRPAGCVDDGRVC